MKQLSIFLITMMLAAMPASAASVDRTAASNSINALRANKNLAALQYSTQLEKTARAHADDMVRHGFFSHTGSDGSNIGKRLTRSGYSWCTAAENIASGQTSLANVMDAWTKSRGHRKNMLNKKVTEFALARGTGNTWVMGHGSWVMVLARPGC